LFGAGPELGLAVSLLKRARDIVIGVPVLILWQAMEGKNALRDAALPGAE
jgi:glycosyltransferase 2 family protein